MDGNDFGWALRAMKNGMHVTRLAWPRDDKLTFNPGPGLMRWRGGVWFDWVALHGDLLAEDWVLASDVKASP